MLGDRGAHRRPADYFAVTFVLHSRDVLVGDSIDMEGMFKNKADMDEKCCWLDAHTGY